MRDGVGDGEVIDCVERAGAVDEQGLVERGLVGLAVVGGKELLHERKDAGDLARRDAGAAVVAPRAAQGGVTRGQIGRGHRRGAQRDDVIAGSDEVGLAASEWALDANAHVAAAGEVGHLVGAVRVGAGERVVGCPRHEAELLGRADGDDVFAIPRLGDGVRRATGASGVGVAGVAHGEDVGHGLVVREEGLGVAHGLVEERGVDAVGGDGVAPTVVDDVDVGGHRGVRDEPDVAVVRVVGVEEGEGINPRAGGDAPVVRAVERAVDCSAVCGVQCGDDAGDERAVAGVDPARVVDGAILVGENPPGELAVREVHARVHEADGDAAAREAEPVAAGRG